MGRTKKDPELSNAISFCKEAMSNQKPGLNNTHNSIDSNAIDVSAYNPFKSDYNGNDSLFPTMQTIPSISTNAFVANPSSSKSAYFMNAMHSSTNDIENYHNFLYSLKPSNTPNVPLLNIKDYFDQSASTSKESTNDSLSDLSECMQPKAYINTDESKDPKSSKKGYVNDTLSDSSVCIEPKACINSDLSKDSKSIESTKDHNNHNNSNIDSNSIESTDKQLVPYNHTNNSSNEIHTVARRNNIDKQTIDTNVCLPQLNELVTFTNNKSSLDKIIDEHIDFNRYSPSDIATFKQYLSNEIETVFKLPNETCEEATIRCFKPGMFFYSIPHLKNVINLMGSQWGFRGSRYGKTVYCSRANTPNSSSKKQNTDERKALDNFRQVVQNKKIRINKSFQCDCKWRIYCTYINSKMPDIVRITKVYPKHTNTCQPSSNQLTIARTKARDYAKLSLCSMRDIMSIIDAHHNVPSKILHPFVKKIFPGRKHISTVDIANIRLRTKVLLYEIKKKGQTIDSYQFESKEINNFAKTIDSCTSDIIDTAVTAMKEVYLEYLNDDNCSTKIYAILEKLSNEDPGFTYNIAFDHNNIATGIVWMTSTMRSNLHRFGSFICLDALKRTTNVFEWPYIGPTIVNDLNKISVVCEAFCVSERKLAYTFVLKSMLQMAPTFDPNVLKVVYCDEFLTDSILVDAGLKQTRLIYDHYHLHLNFNKSIGPLYNNKYRDFFTAILNSNCEFEFHLLLSEARKEFKDNAKVLKEINYIETNKDQCVAYVIDSITGSCAKRGSTHAEQNHSSIMSKLGKDFVGELEDLLKILLERQGNKNVSFNKELSVSYSHMLVKHQNLFNMNKDPILIDAAKYLCEWSFERFQKAYKLSSRYTVECNGNHSYKVYQKKDQIKPPRHFINIDSKCDCVCSVAFQEQCCHEIKLLNKFDINRFSRRHHIREGVTMNANTMGYKNPHCYSHLKIDGFRCSKVGIYEDENEFNDTTLCSIAEKNTPSQSTLVMSSKNENVPIDLSNIDYSEDILKKQINHKNHLSYREAQDIVSKLYSACKRNPQLHVVVGGFLLQMLNIVENKDVSNIASLDDMQSKFTRLINNFNSSFNTIDMFKSSHDISIGFSKPIPNVNNAIKKRLQPMVEKSSKKYRQSNTNSPMMFRRVHRKPKSCRFCSETGHTISSCPTKLLLGEEVAYEQLIHYMENISPFQIASSNDKIMNDFNWKDVYHITISYLRCKVTPGNDRPHPSKFLCNINCFDRIACSIPGYNNILVPMTDVIKHIRSLTGVKTKRVFSKLNTCVGIEYKDCERKNTIQLLSTQVNNCITTQSTSQTLSRKEKVSQYIANQCHLTGESDDDYDYTNDHLNEKHDISMIEEIDNDII